jgi:peptidoglycan hydrolase CwlO-like protein
MENRYIQVQGKNNLVRDSYSNGILNTDVESYNAYIESYKQKHKELKKVESLETELNSIKNDIDEIKGLLKSLLSK